MWERLDAQLCFIICLIQSSFICVCIYIRVMTGQFSVCVFSLCGSWIVNGSIARDI